MYYSILQFYIVGIFYCEIGDSLFCFDYRWYARIFIFLFLFQLIVHFSFLLSVAFCAVVCVALAHLADVYACGTDFTFSFLCNRRGHLSSRNLVLGMLSTIFQEGVFQRFFKTGFKFRCIVTSACVKKRWRALFEADERAGIRCPDPLVRLLQLDFPETISRFLED